MGHAIVFVILGICGWLLPEKEKKAMVQKEAQEWYKEANE